MKIVFSASSALDIYRGEADLSRDTVYQYIYQLRDARLINTLSAAGKGVSTLQKPEKIFLENSNLAYVLIEKPDIGNIRETFVLNQLLNAGIDFYASSDGDFQTGELTIEDGGKNKSAKQVKHLDNYLVAADNIETGAGNNVPVWLFGFLYQSVQVIENAVLRIPWFI